MKIENITIGDSYRVTGKTGRFHLCPTGEVVKATALSDGDVEVHGLALFADGTSGIAHQSISAADLEPLESFQRPDFAGAIRTDHLTDEQVDLVNAILGG